MCMLYICKVVLTSESVDEILKSDPVMLFIMMCEVVLRQEKPQSPWSYGAVYCMQNEAFYLFIILPVGHLVLWNKSD